MNSQKIKTNDKFKEQLDDYFLDVEPFSSQHIHDIKKFSRLLESMKDSQKSKADTLAYHDLKKQLLSFYNYLNRNNIALNDNEKKGITAITGSGFTPVVKKRMIEDIIHKIMQRGEIQRRRKLEEKMVQKEIESLSFSKIRLFDWLRLTIFALEYKTITPITHRLKESTLFFLREKVSYWQLELRAAIQKILDNDYYLLSPLEYNAIETVMKLSSPLDELKKISWHTSYDHRALSSSIDTFAVYYITILKNKEILEKSLEKILKRRKLSHGFRGLLQNLLDKPIHRNKTITYSKKDFMKKTVKGVLYSYYTTRLSVVVNSINQIIYILGFDPRLNDQQKMLTPAAKENDEKMRDKHKDKEQVALYRYYELDRIINTYLGKGPGLEKAIMQHEAKSSYSFWTAEHSKKPLMRIKRLTDFMIKYFIDVFTDETVLSVEYDHEKYSDYLSLKPEIISVAQEYNLEKFELVGSKEKEFINITLPEGTTLDTFMLQLTNYKKLNSPIDPSSIDPSINFSRLILKKIAGLSYEFALQTNELITYYLNQKKIIHANVMENYDFFANAQISSPKLRYLKQVLIKEHLTIKDFLEAACIFAFHIAAQLNHQGIDSMAADREKMESKMQHVLENSVEQGSTEEILDTAYNDMIDNEIYNEINTVYKDSLTGLWKKEYLEDQIIHKLYDIKKCFKLEIPRFVFALSINGFQQFNNAYGHELGDTLLTSVIRILAKQIYNPHKHQADILVRYNEAIILGYINDTSLLSAVEMLQNTIQKINTIQLEGLNIGNVTVNCGIYQERYGTNVYNNIKIAISLMYNENSTTMNNIVFIKNPERVITNKDFEQNDRINNALLTVFH